MKKITLQIPSDWRYGQTIFNFLEFIRLEKGMGEGAEGRMADPFHLQDDEFIEYWNEAYDFFMGVRDKKRKATPLKKR